MATGNPLGVVTHSGEGTVDQLLRRAVARIEARGLEVVAVIDHSGDADEAGIAMPDSKLVLFGNAKSTAELLLAHPRLALDLPFKLLIGERDDGHAFVSHTTPSYLAHRYGLTDDEADALQVVETVAQETRTPPH